MHTFNFESDIYGLNLKYQLKLLKSNRTYPSTFNKNKIYIKTWANETAYYAFNVLER